MAGLSSRWAGGEAGAPLVASSSGDLTAEPVLEHAAREANVAADLQAGQLSAAHGVIDPAWLYGKEFGRGACIEQRLVEIDSRLRGGERGHIPSAPIRAFCPAFSSITANRSFEGASTG